MNVTFCLLSNIYFGKNIICVSDRLFKCPFNNFAIMFFNKLKIFRFWIHPKKYFKFELLVLLFYWTFFIFLIKSKIEMLSFNIESKYPQQFIIFYYLKSPHQRDLWLKLSTKPSKNFIHFISHNIPMLHAEDSMLLEVHLLSSNLSDSFFWVLHLLNSYSYS